LWAVIRHKVYQIFSVTECNPGAHHQLAVQGRALCDFEFTVGHDISAQITRPSARDSNHGNAGLATRKFHPSGTAFRLAPLSSNQRERTVHTKPVRYVGFAGERRTLQRTRYNYSIHSSMLLSSFFGVTPSHHTTSNPKPSWGRHTRLCWQHFVDSAALRLTTIRQSPLVLPGPIAGCCSPDG